jgi:Ca2+-binding EF-hand superfamily protein
VFTFYLFFIYLLFTFYNIVYFNFSQERHSAKELKQQQQKARRKSVALVNSLTPKLASLKTEESYVDTKGEEDGQMGQYTKKRLKNIPKKTKPVAFQAISMAIDAIIKSGQKKLNGHLLLDAESLFCALDVDFSGDVDRKELKAGLRKLKIGCTSSQLEAWIDALDVNGDGSIEQHEFVGFLEGSLDPESQKFLGDSAVSLTRPTSKPTSPLIVDKMLTGINNYCYQDIDHEFIEALQQLERLYIHRKAYQTKVTSGRGGSLARGVGVDLLLSLETVRNVDTKEKLINRMIASDPSNGDLENFVHAWRRMIDLEASSSVKKSLPSTVLYEVERKRRSVTLGGERPVAWKAAQSPAKSQFSFSGSLTESARGGKALENLTPELGERKRYHMKTADRIGLNQPSPPQTQQQQQQQPSNHPPLVLSPSNDRYVMSNRRGSDFGKYASPIIGRAPRVTVTTSSPIIEKSKRRIENAILKYCKNHV